MSFNYDELSGLRMIMAHIHSHAPKPKSYLDAFFLCFLVLKNKCQEVLFFDDLTNEQMLRFAQCCEKAFNSLFFEIPWLATSTTEWTTKRKMSFLAVIAAVAQWAAAILSLDEEQCNYTFSFFETVMRLAVHYRFITTQELEKYAKSRKLSWKKLRTLFNWQMNEMMVALLKQPELCQIVV
jgi:hypothetical protein